MDHAWTWDERKIKDPCENIERKMARVAVLRYTYFDWKFCRFYHFIILVYGNTPVPHCVQYGVKSSVKHFCFCYLNHEVIIYRPKVPVMMQLKQRGESKYESLHGVAICYGYHVAQGTGIEVKSCSYKNR